MRLEEARRQEGRQEGMETSKRMRTGIMRSRHERMHEGTKARRHEDTNARRHEETRGVRRIGLASVVAYSTSQ